MADLFGSYKSGWEEAAQMLGMLGPRLSRSGLSTQKGVLLYEQLMHPLIDSVYLIWWSITHTHTRNLQVLQHKCLNFVINVPWYSYLSYKEIYKDLELLFFADHIRSLMKGFKSKLAGVGNTILWELELDFGSL
jgi:hypothetical protein